MSSVPPPDLQSRLLYRDALMLVLDKPAGIPVHRGPKGDRPGEINLEQFFGQLTFGLPRAPALAHRLDKDTSGCLVLGRHRKALEQLGLMFKQGRIAKTYWSVVEGGPQDDEGLIDKPLGRRDPARGWWMKHDEDGLPSQTRWRAMGRGKDPSTGLNVTWLAMEPLTGRTHQLRVHAAGEGWPMVGDPIYGSAPREGGPMLQLHAREVVVPLYRNKEPVRVVAPAPQHMRALLAACGWAGEEPGQEA